MRRGFFFSLPLFCCLLLSGSAYGSASAVQSVDFYPAGARFTFRAEADGDFAFTIPGTFDPQSVRFLKQDGLSSLKVDTVAVAEEEPEELTPLKEAVAERRRELRLMEAQRAALMQILNLLRAPLSADLADLAQVADLPARLDAARTIRLRYELELVELEAPLAEASEELRKAEEALDARRTALKAAAPSRVLRISGTATKPGPLSFEAYTNAAGWNARYDMDLNSATGLLVARMQARAWQQTGLDLDGAFSFHTRFPSASFTPPEVRPLLVSVGRRPNAGLASRLPGLPEKPIVRTSGSDVQEEAAPAPSLNASLTDVSVTGSGALKGDGTPSDVTLGTFEIRGSALLIAVPEQNREAWIVASLDSVPSALLPGTADLAVDGAGSGKASIPAFGMQTRLPFGMAPRITSVKKPLIGKTGSSWTGKGILEDGYVLEVTNSMETAREVLVRDRLPVPVDDRIQLEVKKIDPAPSERDPDNRLTWTLTLDPGETKTIHVEYALRYPGEEALEYR